MWVLQGAQPYAFDYILTNSLYVIDFCSIISTYLGTRQREESINANIVVINRVKIFLIFTVNYLVWFISLL